MNLLAPGAPTGAAHRVDRYSLLSHIRRADVAQWMLDAVEAPSGAGVRTPMLAA